MAGLSLLIKMRIHFNLEPTFITVIIEVLMEVTLGPGLNFTREMRLQALQISAPLLIHLTTIILAMHCMPVQMLENFSDGQIRKPCHQERIMKAAADFLPGWI